MAVMPAAISVILRMPLAFLRCVGGRIKPKKHMRTAERRYERYSLISERFGFVLLCGLVVELWFAFLLEKPWLEKVSDITEDVLIVVGVWGELQFARLAREAGDALQEEDTARVAEADARAAEANRLAGEAHERAADIERITSFRRVSNAQLEKIRVALRGLIGQIDLLIEYQSGDVEAFVYARDINVTFVGIAGIRSLPNSYPAMNAFGLFIAASPSLDIEVVAKAFTDADIEFSRMHIDLSTHLPRNVPAPNLYIFVAPKAPPPLISPVIPPKPRTRASTTGGAANANP